MIRTALIPLLIGVATLAGCATDSPKTLARQAAVSSNVYAEADAALAAGQS